MAVIYWAGDSTVKQNGVATYPQTGIGQVFHRYLRPDVRVENHAENGRSTKSFLDEGRLAPIYDRMRAGDFLFVQFGHNDEKREDPARYTQPRGTFSQNLACFVNAAANRQAHAVFITPLTRLRFGDPPAPYDHRPYREAMLETARRLLVPCIDLCAMSEALVTRLGAEKSSVFYMQLPAGVYARYPQGLMDGTHLRPEGALVFGGLIARGLYDLGGAYAALLADGYDPQTACPFL